MLTKPEQLNELGELLDRLGPSRQLVVNSRELYPFMPETSAIIGELTIRAARTFAEMHECGFMYDEKSERGVFIRAYFREGT